MANLLQCRLGLGILGILACSIQPQFGWGQDSNQNRTSEPAWAELEWLSGNWICEQDGRTTEEVWMAPRGSMMLGMNRSTNSQGAGSFESLRIVLRNGQFVYLASPSGRPATEFVYEESDERSDGIRRAHFVNESHDFPQRIIYSRSGPNLTARIEGEMNGQTRSMEWKFVDASKPLPADSLFKGLRTVGLRVRDLEAAKKWYSELLGIDPYFDEPFYVGFQVGDFELGLDPDVETMVQGNNLVAYWKVDNCQASYQALLDRGAKPETEPQDVGDGLWVATVVDPFGNILGILEEPDSAEDQ